MNTNINSQATSAKTVSFIFFAASGLIQVSCSNNTSAPIATTIPSQIPVSATPVVAIANQGKVSEYTPEIINQYISVCKAGGMPESECSCFINKAKEIYPLAELIRINNDASKKKKNPLKIEEILQTCRQEQLALVKASLPQPSTTENLSLTSDIDANSSIDSSDQSSGSYIYSSSRNTNIKGYTRKDGTYVSPHTRSSSRVSGFSSSRSSSSS
jgi:hypothetical protein